MPDKLSELEQFNTHQMDIRQRVNSLAKSIFLLSGGALTLSIGVFLRKEAPEVPCELIYVLRGAWISLFFSIGLSLIGLCVMIFRDYNFGERWRRKLSGINLDASNPPGVADTTIMIMGISSIVTFILGLSLLAWVACSLVTKAT